MEYIYSPQTSESISLEVESSPVWETILGIAGYTHTELRHTFDLDESLINPITSESFVQKAPRPRDSSLNVNKVEKELGMKMETCTESLNRMADSE